MALNSDLISQFVKVTNDKKDAVEETTVYGTIVEYDGSNYVQLDGSELLTPVTTTTTVKPGERVTVMIKNHTATVTGNLSSPAARNDDVEETASKITDFEIVLANKVDTDVFVAEQARIDTLVADNVTVKEMLSAAEADIDILQAGHLTVTERLEAAEADIENIVAGSLDVSVLDAKYATIEKLDALNAEFYTLESTYGEFATLTTGRVDAIEAVINTADIENLQTTYANIDFSNIGEAAVEKIFAGTGLIENIIIGDGTITGVLVGVTIKGNTIEGGTVVADKLVIKGEDGLYYKLNTDGITTEAEQTEYNSLNGSVITAKSITATKISVDDLVAFDATIGGFNITDGSLYSGVKESVDNSTSGVFLGSDGQVAFGNAENYLKFYAIYEYYNVSYNTDTGIYTRTDTILDMCVGTLVEDAITDDGYKVYSITAEDETVTYFCRVIVDYKLAISADSILFGSTTKYSLDDVKHLTDHVKVGTYEDNETGEVLPCVELSETDSDFKMRLTNKKAVFMDGINDSTSIDSDGVETENVRVKNDIRHYDYVWRRRSNGNLGLMWVEVTE